jgi:uncharacterized protein (TIGR02598 family)
MRDKKSAFSLIEVVIALGIFTFCAVAIFGLIPIGLDATRSVSQETAANNIAESISGFWQVAPLGAQSGSQFCMGDFTIGTTGNQTLFYNNDGTQVANAGDAALRLSYDVQNLPNFPNSYTVNLTFTWPANAPDDSETANRRFFNFVFSK